MDTPHESSTPGTLAGLKVLDLSRVLAGPWSAQLLGDLAWRADILVENFKVGGLTAHGLPRLICCSITGFGQTGPYAGGQHLDLALLDVQIAALANQASNFLVGGQAPGRLGNAHPNIVPYQDFRTSQVQARGLRIELDHPAAGRVPMVANPIRMSASPVQYRCAPPLPGADARAVLEGWPLDASRYRSGPADRRGTATW